MTDVQKCMFEGLMPLCDEFHHGSCQGVDVEAARLVRKGFVAHITIIAHPGPKSDPHQEDSGVDDVKLPGKSHFARNRDLVAVCDELFAFPGEQWAGVVPDRGGTAYTVSQAVRAGKKLTIVYPDGTIDTTISKK
jgi:hypothetical protein